MPIIVRGSGYRIYVFPEKAGKHHGRHCHVYWDDKCAVIALPTMGQYVGDPLPGAGRKLVESNIDELMKAWEKFNNE